MQRNISTFTHTHGCPEHHPSCNKESSPHSFPPVRAIVTLRKKICISLTIRCRYKQQVYSPYQMKGKNHRWLYGYVDKSQRFTAILLALLGILFSLRLGLWLGLGLGLGLGLLLKSESDQFPNPGRLGVKTDPLSIGQSNTKKIQQKSDIIDILKCIHS